MPGGPTSDGTFTSVTEAEGWTASSGLIELQRRVPGSPASDGGNVFVELDSTANSAMSRTIAAAGSYTLSFLYSPRPATPTSSHGIDILLGGTLLDPPEPSPRLAERIPLGRRTPYRPSRMPATR